MDDAAVTLTAGPLLLRPWRTDDIPALLAAYDDPAMRQWVRVPVSDVADAERWMAVQRDGWARGNRFSFAVTDTTRGGELVGNLALKRPVPGAESAEAGYWTAAAARGRGVASRALGALTDWAFGTFATEGLRRLELLSPGGQRGILPGRGEGRLPACRGRPRASPAVPARRPPALP